MPYAVTFNWKGHRYSSDELFEKPSQANWLKHALVGRNPKIAFVKDYHSCPHGFLPKKGIDDGCIKGKK